VLNRNKNTQEKLTVPNQERHNKQTNLNQHLLWELLTCVQIVQM